MKNLELSPNQIHNPPKKNFKKKKEKKRKEKTAYVRIK